MIPIFSNVTDDGYILLNRILSEPGILAADLFFDFPAVDGEVELLSAAKLIREESSGRLCITELGRSALVAYQKQKRSIFLSRLWSVLTFTIPTILSIIALYISVSTSSLIQ